MPDLPALTGLRFWAAFCILAHHLLLGVVPRDSSLIVPMLAACGSLGMSLFFVLSGFIIHYNYQSALSDFRGRSLYLFIVARIARLYPLYICLFALDALLTRGSSGKLLALENASALPFFLTLSQSWFYQQVETGASLVYMFPRASISWSVSTELLMYCFYPVLLWCCTRDQMSSQRRAVTIISMVVLVSLGLAALARNWDVLDRLGVALFGVKASIASNHSYSFANWLGFLSPYVRIFEFLIGVCLAHLFLSRSVQKAEPLERHLLSWASVIACGFVLMTFLPNAWSIQWIKAIQSWFGYTPFIAILIYTCARLPSAGIPSFFSWKPFVSLGEYSYSIYLFHIFILPLVVTGPFSNFAVGVKVVVFFVTVLLAASILFKYIEAPFRKRVRHALISLWPEPKLAGIK